MSGGKDFPVVCSDCGGYVWIDVAVDVDGNTYCEDCADKEPDEEQP